MRSAQAWGGLGLSGTGLPLIADAAATRRIEAYASACSVRQGGAIVFHARDPGATPRMARRCPLAIVRVAAADVTVLRAEIALAREAVPADASTGGCRWPAAYTLQVPADWPSGLYYAAFGADASYSMVPFVVRPAQPTAGVSLIVQVPVTTAQAYNNYGGRSLYDYNSGGAGKASQVSFDRPFSDPFNFAFDRWQAPFVRWLARNGFNADFCTSLDLHQETAGLLAPYRLLAIAGHDEYWSLPMRQALDAFVAQGGNVALFGGNSMWWQVRLEAAGGQGVRRMVCYKSAAADPTPVAALETVNWDQLSPPWPSQSSIGLGSRQGAIWSSSAPRPDTPFVVQSGSHWAFRDSGLNSQARFGGAWVGYETDTVHVTTGQDGRVYATGDDGAPRGLRVLAWADASGWDAAARALGQGGAQSGHAAMAIFCRGGPEGTVFNAGTTDWAMGLQPELDGQTPNAVGIVTRNVLRRLSSRHVEPADVCLHRGPMAGGGQRHHYGIGARGPAGTALVGRAFGAWLQPDGRTVPIYRWTQSQAGAEPLFLLTPSASLAASSGWTSPSVAFHAYPAAVAGSVPVYQSRQALADGRWSFAYGTAPPASGWVNDGVVFHVPAA